MNTALVMSLMLIMAEQPAKGPLVVWHRYSNDPPLTWRQIVDGVAVGTFDEANSTYKSLDGTTWNFKAPPPERTSPTAASPPPASVPGVPPGGIDAEKLDPSNGEAFTVNGIRVDRQTAFESLLPRTGVDLTDDSTFLRITVIGRDEDRGKVLADLKTNPKFAELLQGCIVRGYAPTNWAVRDCGFVTTGTPTIYIQAPTGRVLHRQDDYSGGPDRLAGAIRRARPDYDPKKDPDLTKPKIEPPPAPVQPPPLPPPTPVPEPPLSPSPAPAAAPWIAAAISLLLVCIFGLRKPKAAPVPA